MWDWFLAHLWILLAFLSTFIYVRGVGAFLRRLILKMATKNWGRAEAVVCYTLSTILPAIFLLLLRKRGLVWISGTALWASLLLDALCLLGMMSYLNKLRTLRKTPELFLSGVSLRCFEDWPSPRVIADALRHLALKIPLLNRRFGRTLVVTVGDFRRFLQNDLRLIDDVPEEDALPEIPQAALRSMPHLFLPDPPQRKVEDVEPEALDIMDELVADMDYDYFSGGTLHIINRTLNSKLPDELWRTSRNLCLTMPNVIANTWKQFHAQESPRLRLVTLFTAADLIQRLLGSLVLSTLRDLGEVLAPERQNQKVMPPEIINQWNRTLGWALETSTTPKLNRIREIMLAPRDDFDSLRESLKPFWKIVGRATIDYPGARNTLTGWRVLSVLRNKLIGHGGIGWQLNLRPTVYLSAVHYYFLAMMRDVAALDLGVLANWGDTDIIIAGKDQGLDIDPTGYFGDDCLALAALPDEQGFAVLNPFLRFHKGRLLILNKVYQASRIEKADYVDYNVDDITEPSFISFNEKFANFLEPRESPTS